MCGAPEVGGVKEKGTALTWSLSPVLPPGSCFGIFFSCSVPPAYSVPIYSRGLFVLFLPFRSCLGTHLHPAPATSPHPATHHVFFMAVTPLGRSVVP